MARRPGAAVPVQDQADAASVAVPTAQAFLAEVAATPKRVPPPAGVGRLRKLASATCWLTGALAPDTALWTDDVWVVDSTPVECGRPRETARSTDLAAGARSFFDPICGEDHLYVTRFGV